MSSPRELTRSARRRALAIRGVSLAVVGLAIAGLVAIGPGTNQPAEAVVSTSSALTVAWTGDTSSAKAMQPVRDTSSPHFAEFDDLSISVSQTTGIVDQAIRVSVTGFAVGTGTVPSPSFDIPANNAMNYLQAMQCWGDPTKANFRQTCQWGGRYVQNNGLGNSVYFDNTLRVATKDIGTQGAGSIDNPFLTVQGRSIGGKPVTVAGQQTYPILDYFNPATSNEVVSARVGADGAGSFGFEAQSADQSPQLGCGNTGQLRCYLVVVPRGTVFGGDGDECSSVADPSKETGYYTKGQANAIQGGSPVSTTCDYWDNRIVIPLDFAPVRESCAVGSAEQRVVGSQLMVGAMSSWQPDLCSKLKTTYSFSTNPDVVARKQLLEGTASVAFSSQPLTPGELANNDDRQVLATTTLSYAPVAISGVTVAFLAEFDSGRQETLNLSPRLVAKLLTQSYPFQIPTNVSDSPEKAISHLPAANRAIRFLNQDPEFQQLNPTTWRSFSQNPGIVLPGPAGADAIRQVWRWILSDAEAVAFLNGTPDPTSKIAVNPYYLPAGNAAAVVPTYDPVTGALVVGADGKPALTAVGLANVDGSALRLSEVTLDTFIKADRTLAPIVVIPNQSRFDSIQFTPYTDDLLSAARLAFRADPNSKSVWDPTKLNPASPTGLGDWVSSGAQIPGQKFMLAITDTPSAIRYGLDMATIRVSNSTELVQPDSASMAAALSAIVPTIDKRVSQVDPAKVTGKGYPLTIVTYAQVNLTRSSVSDRTNIANLITQATTTGQVQGTAPGQLPNGYYPLTSTMVTQAAASVSEIRAFVPPANTNGPAQDDYEAGNLSGFDDAGEIADGSGTDPVEEPGVDADSDTRTPASASEPIARGGLALSLILGIAGALVGPILFRGRGLL